MVVNTLQSAQGGSASGPDRQTYHRIDKLQEIFRQETCGFHLRLMLASVLLAPLPPFTCSRLRVYALRKAGFQIGHGTVMWGLPTFTGIGDIYQRLIIGTRCVFNTGCVFDLEAPITIGTNVAFGHEVMVLT